MDPLSISASCAGLLSGIANLSLQISRFVGSVRDARKDMDAVRRELSSLSFCLETMRDDSLKIQYPEVLRDNLLTVLKNCDTVVAEMTALLEKLSSANIIRKILWSAVSKDSMNQLRSSLESHKSALDIGLEMTTLLLLSAVKEDVVDVKSDTAAIRVDTAHIPSIKQDTSQIELLVQQIGFLRLQLETSSEHDAKAQHLQRFLAQSTTYAETVIGSIDDELPGPNAPMWVSLPNFENLVQPELQRNSDLIIKRSAHDNSQTIALSCEEISSETSAAIKNVECVEEQAKRPWPQQPPSHHTSSQVSIFPGEPPRSKGQTKAVASKNRFLVSTRDKQAIERAKSARNLLTLKARMKLDAKLASTVREGEILMAVKPAWFLRGNFAEEDAIKKMLKSGADPDCGLAEVSLTVRGQRLINGSGSAMHVSRFNMIILLLQWGASFDLRQANLWIFPALRCSEKSLVQDFLECGVSGKAREYDDLSALDLAFGGRTDTMFEIVKLLIQHGAEAKDAPVHKAAEIGPVEFVKLLLEHGGSANSRGLQWGLGLSALDYAMVKSDNEMVEVLLDHGAIVGPAHLRLADGTGFVRDPRICSIVLDYYKRQKPTRQNPFRWKLTR